MFSHSESILFRLFIVFSKIVTDWEKVGHWHPGHPRHFTIIFWSVVPSGFKSPLENPTKLPRIFVENSENKSRFFLFLVSNRRQNDFAHYMWVYWVGGGGIRQGRNAWCLALSFSASHKNDWRLVSGNREAANGSTAYFGHFPTTKVAKNSPVTGPNLNPLPFEEEVKNNKNNLFNNQNSWKSWLITWKSTPNYNVRVPWMLVQNVYTIGWQGVNAWFLNGWNRLNFRKLGRNEFS